MAMIARHLPSRARAARRPHRPAGTALLAAGIGCGMAALVQWDALGGRALAALARLRLLPAPVRRRRAPAADPMLAAHLLRRPVILAANVSALRAARW